MTTQNQLTEQVKSIANDISDNDNQVCYDCEHMFEGYEDCPECASDNVGDLTANEYLSDVLDIEYYCNSNKEYLGARILVAFGGPNIWIDTRYSRVEGYWWSDRWTESFTDALGLDDYCKELFECM